VFIKHAPLRGSAITTVHTDVGAHRVAEPGQ
jgi:hypothetical protein